MADHFKFIAPFYDQMMRPFGSERLRALLKLPVNGWILDAGGGTGRIAAELCAAQNRIIVADYSLPMLQRACAKKGLNPLQSRIEKLPFPDASFERILVVDALHHFRNQRQALQELLRVLKPDGCMVIEEPNIERLMIRFVAWGEKIAGMKSRFLPPDAICNLIRKEGATAYAETDHRLFAWIVVEK